ncbi:MAG: hypothetical protein HFJ59_07770 [Clostridia bacterium]|nr:hypothetical protein [Clostridia bacterium]
MYNLIRFFNQNRKKIFWIILIIVSLLLLMQLLDWIAQNKTKQEMIIVNNSSSNDKADELVTDKSLVSGETISSSYLNSATDVINEFVNYCNKEELQKAYDMLTDECKEVMFSNINSFKKIYYDGNFKGEKKSCTIENWLGNTYKVNFTGDILSTGDLTNSGTTEDYITIVKNEDGYKININEFISRKESNKLAEYNGVEIKIETIDTYMDYEIYNLVIINNTEKAIFLGDCNNSKSIYLLDSNDMKYYFYGNEIAQNQLIISSNNKTNINIKFSNSFSSSRKIKRLVFSEVIFDYNHYYRMENKEDYEEKYKLSVDC